MTHNELLRYENTPGIEELISALVKVYETELVEADRYDYAKRYDYLGGRSIKDIVHGITEDGRDADSFLNVLKALTANEKTGNVFEFYIDFAENCPGGEARIRAIFDRTIDFFHSGEYSREEPDVRERMLYYLNVLPNLGQYLSDVSAAKALECACLFSGAAEAGKTGGAKAGACKADVSMEEFYEVAVESLTAILAHSEKGRPLLLERLKNAYTEAPAFADEALVALTCAGIKDEEIYRALRSFVKAEKDMQRLFYLLECVEIYGDPRAVSFLRTKAQAMCGMPGEAPADPDHRMAFCKILDVIEALGGNTELGEIGL